MTSSITFADTVLLAIINQHGELIHVAGFSSKYAAEKQMNHVIRWVREIDKTIPDSDILTGHIQWVKV